jgi:hypothetical protein
MAKRNRLASDDDAATEVLPANLAHNRLDTLADAAAELHGRYQEYLRLLDEVPVLVDVVREPARAPSTDFRLGQRPDTRKAPRDDAVALRDEHGGDVVRLYDEYLETCAALVTTVRSGPRKAARNPTSKKKRAKRAKHSARSKS